MKIGDFIDACFNYRLDVVGGSPVAVEHTADLWDVVRGLLTRIDRAGRGVRSPEAWRGRVPLFQWTPSVR